VTDVLSTAISDKIATILCPLRMKDFGTGYPESKEFGVLELSSIIRFVEEERESSSNKIR
jgi:hypothetical protein